MPRIRLDSSSRESTRFMGRVMGDECSPGEVESGSSRGVLLCSEVPSIAAAPAMQSRNGNGTSRLEEEHDREAREKRDDHGGLL